MKADFSKILNEAFSIAIRNKWLWIFAFVLLATGGAGGGGGGGGDFGSTDSTKTPTENQKKLDEIFQKYKKLDNPTIKYLIPLPVGIAGQVLGEYSVSIKELLEKIPFYYLVLLIAAIFVSALLSFGVILYANSWSNASLIHGIDLESEHKFVSLADSSRSGRGRAIEVLKVRLFPNLIVTLVLLVVFVIFALLFVFTPEGFQVVLLLLTLILFFIYLIFALFVAASSALGTYAVVLDGLDWRSAYKRGSQVLKKYFVDVALMFLVNCCLAQFAGILSCVIIIPLILAFGIAGFGVISAPATLIVSIPLAALVVLAVIAGLGVFGVIVMVFVKSTWVLLYKELRKFDGGVKITESIPSVPDQLISASTPVVPYSADFSAVKENEKIGLSQGESNGPK